MSNCEWCGEPAVAELIVKGAKKRTIKGRDAYSKETTALVCRTHKESFESRGMSTREMPKEKK